MPQSRRARPQGSKSYADSDSDDNNEQETPKPQRQPLKKRVSEVYAPDAADASFSSDGGRVPLRSVNINDDAAEKRRRRKSTKLAFAENAQAGPSSEGAEGDTNDASRGAALGKQKSLTSVDAPAMIDVPLDVMSSNFEEWMKMATDNKINAANSWNFALIDYFHDMSLLRNNTDNTINFQRASCTLDGCVKIWTSRVDSVGTETGKLLSNLATEGNGDDDDEPTSDNDAQDPSQPRKRKTHRPESTLAKSAAQLRNKKLDLDFSVDPLFKKTCADFDEGGAQGLLMNHLSLGVGTDGGLRVVFDASDSLAKSAEDEEEPQEPEEDVDLSYLRKQFLPDLSVLEDKAISHSLAGFSFSKDSFSFDDTFFREDTRHDDDDEGNEPFNDMPMDVDGGDGAPEDFFVGEQAVGDDYGGGPDDYGGGDSGSVGAEGEQMHEGGGGGRPGAFVPFDPRNVPNQRDLVMAMTDGDGENGMLDYFDQTFLKNWAGPEHWKLRRVVRRPENTEPAAPKGERKKKEAFKIDFITPSEVDLKETAKTMFAPVTRGAGINLPGTYKGSRSKKSKEKEKKDDHRLPDDMHFTSRQLVTLFLKPKFSLKMRGQRVRFNENGDGEVDENFWAQAAANQAAGRADDDGDETANGGAIPFNTQFFHDDYDDGPGFDDVDDGDMGGPSVDAGEQDLLAATAGQTRRVKPEFVNYAKRAKRVDVRKLKENIWRGLDIKLEQKDEHNGMDVDDTLPTDPSEPRVFSSVLSGLQKSYPREKMEEISTSFCFICLLHLANEQGLKLESTENGGVRAVEDEMAEEMAEVDKQSQVGNLWDLKVYRDPHATPAA
ncbi:hypothetical protein PLICRDRAFT_44259 [Plicaturopsis crispa FD-325 SS-3]|nr:hypothetical protein PLICRDRAFT_44259 [Plicaturopsis crispa FD-325 SS-3]